MDFKNIANELSYWKEQLELFHSGHFVHQLEEWDARGKPVYGKPIAPFPEVEELLKKNIAKCEKAIEDKHY